VLKKLSEQEQEGCRASSQEGARHSRMLNSTSKTALMDGTDAGAALDSSQAPVVVVRVREEGGHYSVGEERDMLVAEEMAFLLATVGQRALGRPLQGEGRQQ
jgi:hypothetical protein